MSSVLPIRQTESLISLRRSCCLFQQNRTQPKTQGLALGKTPLHGAWRWRASIQHVPGLIARKARRCIASAASGCLSRSAVCINERGVGDDVVGELALAWF